MRGSVAVAQGRWAVRHLRDDIGRREGRSHNDCEGPGGTQSVPTARGTCQSIGVEPPSGPGYDTVHELCQMQVHRELPGNSGDAKSGSRRGPSSAFDVSPCTTATEQPIAVAASVLETSNLLLFGRHR